jgi:hypothetical protein
MTFNPFATIDTQLKLDLGTVYKRYYISIGKPRSKVNIQAFINSLNSTTAIQNNIQFFELKLFKKINHSNNFRLRVDLLLIRLPAVAVA